MSLGATQLNLKQHGSRMCSKLLEQRINNRGFAMSVYVHDDGDIVLTKSGSGRHQSQLVEDWVGNYSPGVTWLEIKSDLLEREREISARRTA